MYSSVFALSSILKVTKSLKSITISASVYIHNAQTKSAQQKSMVKLVRKDKKWHIPKLTLQRRL